MAEMIFPIHTHKNVLVLGAGCWVLVCQRVHSISMLVMNLNTKHVRTHISNYYFLCFNKRSKIAERMLGKICLQLHTFNRKSKNE